MSLWKPWHIIRGKTSVQKSPELAFLNNRKTTFSIYTFMGARKLFIKAPFLVTEEFPCLTYNYRNNPFLPEGSGETHRVWSVPGKFWVALWPTGKPGEPSGTQAWPTLDTAYCYSSTTSPSMHMLFLAANSWLESQMAKGPTALLVEASQRNFCFSRYMKTSKKPPLNVILCFHVFSSYDSLTPLTPQARTALGSHQHFSHKALGY